MITGAQAMVRCLEAEGVEILFGYPGAAICPFYDALSQSSIRHILTRTEQNAGHAASGYARMAGRPGVCVATSGPGATNLFTALATAYSDSVPLVAITGQVAAGLLGRDVFQEVDTTGAAEPFTKYTYLVKDAREIPRVFREAFYIASTGRPGPVLIDMPVDVQRHMLEFSYPQQVEIRGYKPRFRGHAMQVKRVALAIREAKKPLLCLGGGVHTAGAAGVVRALCEQCSLPAVSTLMGLGALPSAHPLFFGMLGQSGAACANRAVEESDLLIIIGARVGDRAIGDPRGLERSRTVVHIDVDSAEIGKNLGAAIPLVGDAGEVARQLLALAQPGGWEEWLACLRRYREEDAYAAKGAPAHPDGIDPAGFVRALSDAMEEDAVYIADVGQNQMWSARGCVLRAGRFLTTGGMGTMGYALPAAIGAKLAAPARQVVAVCGDGAFQMAMMELATARQHGVPVKLVVMRNDRLGLVREIQDLEYGGRRCAVSLSGGPELGKIAAAYGIPSMQLHSPEKTDEAIAALLVGEGSFLLECIVDPEEGT